MRFEAGSSKTREFVVTDEMTARHMGSGKSDILATPALVAAMEAVAQELADASLPEGWESVGSAISLTHTAMVPPGTRVTVVATLVEAKGRELGFHLSAKDASGTISEGTHRRTFSKTSTLARMLKMRK